MSIKIFKNIILSYFLFLFFLFLLGFQHDSDEPFSDGLQEFYVLFGVLVLLVFLYCLYSLYKLKPIGKKLFVPLVLIGTMVEYLIGYETFTRSDLERFLLNLEGVLVGIIFTCLYFTDLKKEFEK